MYEEGVGVDQDLQKAIFWYQQAAAQGDVDSTEILTDLQKSILKMIKGDEFDEDPMNLGLTVDVEDECDDELLDLAQEPITVWVSETHDGSRLLALAVPLQWREDDQPKIQGPPPGPPRGTHLSRLRVGKALLDRFVRVQS